MRVLPIVERELLVRARQPATYWLRLGTGAGMLLIWLVLNLGSQRNTSPAHLSEVLFVATSVIGFAIALLSGIFLTADCLSMEKREGTLGLLFLTDLRGYDVALGKLAASSVSAGYALLAIFPVMGLSLLLGGVTPAEFGRQILVLGVTLLFSLCLGLFISAISRDGSRAMAATFLVLLALNGGVPVLTGLMAELRWVDFEDNPANWVCAVVPFAQAFDTNYRSSPGPLNYIGSLGLLASAAGALIIGACLLLPRRWQDADTRPLALNRDGSEGRPNRSVSPAASSAERSDNALGSPPVPPPDPAIAGKRGSDRAIRRATYAVMGAWLAVLLLMLNRRTRDYALAICYFGAWAAHLSCKCLAAIQATRRMGADRRSGALEILLVTPLAPRAIVNAEAAALRRSQRAPGAMVALINLTLLALLCWGLPRIMASNERQIFTLISCGGLVLLPLDLWALRWVGMDQAVRRRHQHWATLATLAKVMLGPILCLLIFIFISALDWWSSSEKAVQGFLSAWFPAGALLDLALGFSARHRLRRHLRALVAGERRR